jgi:cytochrome bd ubiquinol oxidase subunit I
MSNLLAARSQMAMSLAFHIVFAVVGMGMPLLMALSEWRWLRGGDEIDLLLAKRWAKGTAVLFAVGAVSGTVLSFELGLLWPKFMSWAGAIIGMPFSLEGFAFFAEAIFLGVYLYGWDRISPRAHLTAGVLVAVSGAVSGMFVVFANAWMNTPAGFLLRDGQPVEIHPMVAMFNPSAWPQSIHMLLASYAATGFVVAGIHAYALLNDQRNLFHRRALELALLVGGIGAILQPLSGDFLGKSVALHQPVKLAATEGQFESETHAPLRIGGWPDTEQRRTSYAIEIPGLLSFVAFGDSSALVHGLNEFPREAWPPVAPVHISFQIMVVSGFAMTLVALWAAWRQWRSPPLAGSRVFLWTVAASAPLGFIAVEAGWFVTELGRQPWIIQGIMRTADAVTPMPGLIVPFLAITLLYLVLAVIVIMLLAHQVRESHGGGDSQPHSGEVVH